jgi:hypothetical protein
MEQALCCTAQSGLGPYAQQANVRAFVTTQA